MLHLVWYIIVGLIAGFVAKSLMHTHLTLLWTIVLGIVGSIIGGAVTHLFSPPSAGGRFHPAGLIVSILWSHSGFISLAPVQAASTQRVRFPSTDFRQAAQN